MKIKNKIYGFLIAFKNRQIRFERERLKALEETNKILSAYIAILVEELGETRISKELVREALGSFKASVRDSGDDYLISVSRSQGNIKSLSLAMGNSFCSDRSEEYGEEFCNFPESEGNGEE